MTVLPNKTCTGCRQTKPSHFFPIVGGKKNTNKIRRTRCKLCVNIYHKKLRETDKIKNTIRRIHLKKSYGITLADYDTLLEAQDFRCAICRDGELVTRNGKVKRLTVDHNHVTGQNRGLLCQSCNVGLGYFRESAELLKAAINYLESHKNNNIMKINDAFPSKYLKAGDLPDDGSSQAVTISSIEMEEVGPRKDKRWVLHFSDLDKGMVCNKTNAKAIARALGSEDSDDWIGKQIYLYSTEVEFQGDIVDGIRVRSKAPSSGLKQDNDNPF